MPDIWHTTPHGQAPNKALVVGDGISNKVQWCAPGNAGDGSGNGDDEMPLFDLTLYQGTVEFNPTNDPVIAQYITFDSDITWYAQWGKVAEFKFRATVPGTAQQQPAPLIPALVPLARLRGLGLFADDYHEILPAHAGTLGTDPDLESGGSVVPAVIRQVDPGDWTQGYDFMLQQGFVVPPVGKDAFLRAGTMLTSAMYFRNGQCILDDPQYVQVG